jgi:methylmalonyl-CoA/ethylmalonyl-CoA epimerase
MKGLRLHHVGVVVEDVARATEHLRRRFGYRPVSGIIHDPMQTAFAQFLSLPADSALVEVVAPDSDKSRLTGALKRGGGLNHLCYATDDLEADCHRLREQDMVLIHEPGPAVAFPGRRIAWLMGNDRIPIELLEEGTDEWSDPTGG